MITLNDIARETGLSKTAVSYILNGKHEKISVTAETAQRVKDTARRMGYRTDDIARAMSTGKANVIGFVSENTVYEYVAGILNGVISGAAESSYFIKLLKYDPERGPEELVNICRPQRLSGMICHLVKDDHLKFIREKLEPEGVRLATVAHTPNYDSVIDITANDRQGISLAVEHLTGLGHRKIAYLGMHPDLLYGIRRRQGFYDGMAKHGLSVPESYCLHSIDVREIDEYLLRLIKSSSNRPSAIICASDMYALRAITLFLKIGVRVPEDVSVLGYGETTACRYSTPSITTIAEPYERIGQTLANKLITAIKNGSRKTTPVHETLDVSLIQRESTGPLISTHGKG